MYTVRNLMSSNSANTSIARVESSFKKLAAAAQALNSASDDLGKVIRHLDASLKKLALGITAWVQINGTSDDTQYWTSEIGYAKVDGKWGLVLREVTGYLLDNTDESEEVWIFSEAPRTLRTESVTKIPDLLEKLLELTEDTTKDLVEKFEQAAEITLLVSNLVPNTPAATPQYWSRPGIDTGSAEPAKKQLEQGDGSMGAKSQGKEASGERVSPAGAAATGANGRFREVDAASAERPATPARVLPAERVV